MSQQFASDNWAGICPSALQALIDANVGHEPAYGDDAWTQKVSDRIRELFETDCDVYFVFNGTAANAISLASLCQSYHSVICHETAHVETHECGAPEFYSNGAKLLVASGPLGKLTPESVEPIITRRNDIHYPKPRVLSLTQVTELGTVYTEAEIRALSALAKSHGMRMHMDGSRFANAVAALDVSPAALTWRAGVDVLCFGGTKNGLPVGEAVLFFDHDLSEDFAYRCKQAGQLASKMRFVSAPWLGLLSNDVWRSNARHANAMAKRFEKGMLDIRGTHVLAPVEANSVFLEFPIDVAAKLRTRGWQFHDFIAMGGCRFTFSWDVMPERVDELIADVRLLCESL